MLDIKYIREHAEEITDNIQKRRSLPIDISALLKKDSEYRGLMIELEQERATKNALSKTKPTEEIKEQSRACSVRIDALEQQTQTLKKDIDQLLLLIPNFTHADAPIGGEDDFRVVEIRGTEPGFSFAPKDHETLFTEKGLLDFERGAKVVGSKFYYQKNALVQLNHALLSYGIDIVKKHGFDIFETPDLAKEEILTGAGFNPRGEEDQIYCVENTGLAMIGTAEITMLGYHANEVLDLSTGPKKYAALSHCYRKEAGAYGRTSKGLYRVHQFTKLEMFIFCTPEQSEALHQELLAIEKEICDGLGLHYRIIDIASGDLGAPAYRKYDIEGWMTMKGTDKQTGDFGEITSTSNCLDYQARRLNIKYTAASQKNEFVHTLNGTAIVLSRFPIVIAEQYQEADGRIRIPQALRPYMGNKEYID